MTVYTFPTINPTTSDLSIVGNTKVFRSPLNGFIVTGSRTGTRWQFKHLFANLFGEQRAIMQAYLARQNSQVHRALIYDHSYHGARGALGGTPLIDGAVAAGAGEVDIKGMSNSITDIFKAGDLISFLNTNGFYELKMILTDMNSDGSGDVASIPIYPETHQIIDDGATVVTTNPAGTFMLAKSGVGWSNRPEGSGANSLNPNLSNISVDWIEDMQ
jgi:hypothetical protein|tara:strand:- start:1741 stop:2388 length:648 start_codon:yes stop_codon:yes gene_type:complete